ncbi:ribosome maturation factor RimP [Thermodesulfobacteriota bacterium]
MPSKTESIVDRVVELIESVLQDMKFELVDVEYLREHGKWVLRLYIDKEMGVTLDDCVRVSREIGDLIDIKDIVFNEYVLEVSSPGINRPLKKEKDFLLAVGKKIKVRTYSPIGERKNFTGYLEALKGEALHLIIDGEQISLPLKGIEKANIVFEF